MQSFLLRRLVARPAGTSIPRLVSASWQSPSIYRAFHSTPQTATNTPSPFRLTSKPTPSTPATESNSNPSIDYDYDPDAEYDPLARYAPYKPKRQWPPDMTKLSSKHQFRLERKYRRRAALKFARPKWTKGTKLVQWGVILFTLVYAVLFMEWDNGRSPFDELRETVFAGAKGVFSAPPAKKVDKE